VARPAVIVALPPNESIPVSTELLVAGFEVFEVEHPRELEKALDARRDVALAILDGEVDAEERALYVAALQNAGRPIATLTVVSPRAFERLTAQVQSDDLNEYFTRPYSADAIRWRVEAMCIRRETVDDGSGPILQGGAIGLGGWNGRATTIAVFNPKGGVGKTTVATNLAAALVTRGQRVLLIDADTVTGHVSTSLGMDAVPTVIDAWRDEVEGGPVLTFEEQASVHSSGLKVLPLSSHPLNTELLEPHRVSGAIAVARRAFDYVIVDLHPSYSPLNRAVFDKADRILVPVTPDLPAIRAVVKLRDVADELGMRDRLALIVNRSNTGVPVSESQRVAPWQTSGRAVTPDSRSLSRSVRISQ
jgi:cellulose biosynthesis protein BcsQ